MAKTSEPRTGGRTTRKSRRSAGDSRASAPIGRQEIIDGLAKIAADETAPVTARVSAYSLLGKHLGLFAGSAMEPGSDLAALMREIADRNRAEGAAHPQSSRAGRVSGNDA